MTPGRLFSCLRNTVSHENAMDLDSHLLLQSPSQVLLVNAERCGVPRKAMRCATATQNSFRDSFLRRCSWYSSGFVSLDSGLPDRKRRNREGCLFIAHQARRHEFAISAMSISRDSDDGAQMPREKHTEAAMSSKYPCLYLKSSVSSGESIRYPGTVVVLGDVEGGGAIIADGDIIVLGRLQGDVHGGQNGNRGAVVYATQLDACHIRVAEAPALVSMSQFAGCPAIASVQEDGTLGIRAAAQKFNDNKEASNSSIGVKESSAASKGSESTDPTSSKRPAQLALFTGVYISVVGMALLIFPTPLFGALFDVRVVTVGWIRVGAILAVVFGVYYIGTAIGDMRGSSGARAFYMSTVVGRVFLFFGFCWLVAAGAAQRALLLVGIVNMLGAMSMLFALRQDSKARIIDPE